MRTRCQGVGRRSALFDPEVPKQKVSVTLNSDLYANAKRAGIDVSRVTEEAAAKMYLKGVPTAPRAELEQNLYFADAYAERHGSFAHLVCLHYQADGGAVLTSIRVRLPQCRTPSATFSRHCPRWQRAVGRAVTGPG